MARTIRSARGVEVDFDLLRIKQEIGSAPKASVVKAREDFIDQKFKRRLRRLSETVVPSAAPFVEPAAAIKAEVALVAEHVVEEVEQRVAAPTKKKIIKAAE